MKETSVMIDDDRDKRGAMEKPVVKKRDEYKRILESRQDSNNFRPALSSSQ